MGGCFMNKTSLSMINLAYFSANFPDGFISDVWSGSEADHLEQKFSHHVFRSMKGYCDIGSFFTWFLELDATNQSVLCDWIELNYHYSTEHFLFNGSPNPITSPIGMGKSHG
jgi:hypothetical protein